jgi:hypothetical protein
LNLKNKDKNQNLIVKISLLHKAIKLLKIKISIFIKIINICKMIGAIVKLATKKIKEKRDQKKEIKKVDSMTLNNNFKSISILNQLFLKTH